jgi:UDP-N-acetylenolpyruvoylglucosamine reductase
MPITDSERDGSPYHHAAASASDDRAAVHDRQALVLVNRGEASGHEVMALAAAIQESVFDRFGIRLESEPIVL